MINSEYNHELSFDSLTISITQINTLAADTAKRSINQLLTLRNWAIGYYIVEYEQGGNDRANYGDNLLELLEAKVYTKRLNVTLFRVCRLGRCFHASHRGCHWQPAPPVEPYARSARVLLSR